MTLTAARVRVDFNPPLSGRKVRGKFRIAERIVEPAEQARALVELQYGFGSEFHVEHREKTFTIKVPDRTKFDPYWFAAKARIVEKLRKQLHPETIRFQEEWVTPVAETKPTAEAKAVVPAETGPLPKEKAPRPAKAGAPKSAGDAAKPD